MVLMCGKQNLLSAVHGALICSLCCRRSGNGANLGGSPGTGCAGASPRPCQLRAYGLRRKDPAEASGRLSPSVRQLRPRAPAAANCCQLSHSSLGKENRGVLGRIRTRAVTDLAGDRGTTVGAWPAANAAQHLVDSSVPGACEKYTQRKIRKVHAFSFPYF